MPHGYGLFADAIGEPIDSAPIATARVYACKLVGSPPRVQLVPNDPNVFKLTDAQGRYDRPAAFAQYPRDMLGVLAEVTYTEPGSGLS